MYSICATSISGPHDRLQTPDGDKLFREANHSVSTGALAHPGQQLVLSLDSGVRKN